MKMTEEEFKNQVKPGDKIRHTAWGKSKNFLEVKCFGDRYILGSVSGGPEDFFIIDDQWEFYKEPVEKDLEDVFEFYVVKKIDESIDMSIEIGNKSRFKHVKAVYKEYRDIEIITKEEAIERGLKI